MLFTIPNCLKFVYDLGRESNSGFRFSPYVVRFILCTLFSSARINKMATNLYDFTVTTIDGNTTTLAPYRNKTLLIVNVASRCGFTKQYAGLEQLYQRYHDKGLVILGFPCNQFGGQEPEDESTIKKFCETTYQVTFPLFSKIDVNGKNAHPLYVYLKSQAKGALGTEAIKWNFTKFLVSKQGQVVDRFASATTPEKLEVIINQII